MSLHGGNKIDWRAKSSAAIAALGTVTFYTADEQLPSVGNKNNSVDYRFQHTGRIKSNR